MCAAQQEAVQRWRSEKEARLSGDKQPQEEEEEEKSIYTVHCEQVNLSFQEVHHNHLALIGGQTVVLTAAITCVCLCV